MSTSGNINLSPGAAEILQPKADFYILFIELPFSVHKTGGDSLWRYKAPFHYKMFCRR